MRTTFISIGLAILALGVGAPASAQDGLSFARASASINSSIPSLMLSANDQETFPSTVQDIESTVEAILEEFDDDYAFEARAETGFVNPMRLEAKGASAFSARATAFSQHRTLVRIIDPNNVVAPNTPVTVITELSLEGMIGAAVEDGPNVQRAAAELSLTVELSEPNPTTPTPITFSGSAIVNASNIIPTFIRFVGFDDSDFEMVQNASVDEPYDLIGTGDLYRVNFGRLFPSIQANVGDTIFYGVGITAAVETGVDSAGLDTAAISDYFFTGLNDFRALDEQGNELDVQFVIGNDTPFPDPDQFRTPSSVPAPGALPIFGIGLLGLAVVRARKRAMR